MQRQLVRALAASTITSMALGMLVVRGGLLAFLGAALTAAVCVPVFVILGATTKILRSWRACVLVGIGLCPVMILSVSVLRWPVFGELPRSFGHWIWSTAALLEILFTPLAWPFILGGAAFGLGWHGRGGD